MQLATNSLNSLVTNLWFRHSKSFSKHCPRDTFLTVGRGQASCVTIELVHAGSHQVFQLKVCDWVCRIYKYKKFMFKSFVNKNCLSMLWSVNSRSHLWPQCWRARQQWEQSWCCLNCQPVRKQKLITDSLKERTIHRYSSLLSIRLREHTTTISFWKIHVLWLLRTTLKSNYTQRSDVYIIIYLFRSTL